MLALLLDVALSIFCLNLFNYFLLIFTEVLHRFSFSSISLFLPVRPRSGPHHPIFCVHGLRIHAYKFIGGSTLLPNFPTCEVRITPISKRGVWLILLSLYIIFVFVQLSNWVHRF